MNRTLQMSLEEEKCIDMIYMNKCGELTQRIIKVLEINEDHIKAFCFLRKEKRTFRKENILSVFMIRSQRKVGA